MEYCDTLHPSGYRLLFSDELIKPGTDSFLLADFARPKRGMQVCDLGAGIGLLGLLLLNRCPELTVHSVELQPAAAAMLRRNIDANGLQTRMMLHEADLRALRGVLPAGGMARGRCARPPGRRPCAPSAMSAGRRPTCCAGAGTFLWSTGPNG